jgi:AcrR family transcriptional regulator
MELISQDDRGGTRLPRGPHQLSAEEVEADQRLRLLSAITQLAATKGYCATPVADLIQLAGVSRRTFYALFPNREELLKAAFAESSSAILARTAQASGRTHKRSRRLETLMRSLCEEAYERPGTIALCAVEITAVGLAGIQLRESFMNSYGELLGTGEGAVPAHLAGMLAGALHRQLDSYRLQERGAELLDLAPQLARWARSYHQVPTALRTATVAWGSSAEANGLLGGRAPGTLSLALSGRPPLRRPSREALEHARRERILDAVAQLNTEHGYTALTAETINARAELPARSFRMYFTSVEESFAAAMELGHMRGQAIVERAREWSSAWSDSVMDGVRALLEFLGSEPHFTRLAFLDAPLAGPAVARRSSEHAAGYGRLLVSGAPRRTRPPEIATEAVGHALFELVHRHAAEDRLAELHHATALTGYMLIAPFLGGAQAAEAALAR